MLFEPKIGFFIKHSFHRAMLQPVYERLCEHAQCLISDDYDAIVQFQPGILILAEHHNAFTRADLPQTLIVSTTHGFGLSKNYAQHSLDWYDFVCIPSEWYRDYCTANDWLPRMDFWVTGFSAMDAAIRADPTVLPPTLNTLGRGPRLMFCPTFTEHLNALDVLGTQWMQSLSNLCPELNIIIKLHPHTAPQWIPLYRQVTAKNPKWLLIEEKDASVYELMPYVDILLTDISSVAFHFLYFDRPIILVNNPGRIHNPERFDPDGLIWKWRDMGTEINGAAELAGAVQSALNNPEEQSQARLQYRQKRFGELADDQASQRIAEQVLKLLYPSPEDHDRVQLIRNTLRSLDKCNKSFGSTLAPTPGQVSYSYTFN